MPKDLGIAIDERVTAGLHPQNVGSMEDYDSDTEGVLAQVATAFDTAYQGIIKVHEARKAAASDPTLTEAAQLMRTQDMSDKVFKNAAGALDKALANMKSGISLIETELAQPMQARAAHLIAQEIRTYARGLKSQGGSVLDFVRRAIESGDSDTVSSVLGAQPYLSGITDDMQKVLLRMAHEKADPVRAKRLRAMQAARDLLMDRSGLLHSQLEKAVGVPPHKVKELRDAKSKADKAFLL